VCRKWIWIAILFNIGAFIVLTQLAAFCLAYSTPPQRRVTAVNKQELTAALKCASAATAVPICWRCSSLQYTCHGRGCPHC
jgi:hypothetical protein